MTAVLNEFRSALAAEQRRQLLQLLRQKAHELTLRDLRVLLRSSLGRAMDDFRLNAVFNDTPSLRPSSVSLPAGRCPLLKASLRVSRRRRLTESSAAERVARPRRDLRRAVSSGRRRDRLSEHELRCVTIHLTPPSAVWGFGATQIRELSEVMIRLIESGLGDQLLRISQLKALIAERTGVTLHCHNRTFTRALSAIAKYTPLIVRDGRRWWLRFGELRDENSELLRLVMSSVETRPNLSAIEVATRRTSN